MGGGGRSVRVPAGIPRAIGIGVMLGLVAATASVSLGILSGSHPIDDRFIAKYVRHWGLVAAHGFSAVVALVSGAAQLAAMHLRVLPGAHRSTGRVYALAVLVAGITAIPMGAMAHGGPTAQLGMTINALLWIGTLVPAVALAVRRDIAGHRAWILRNYALTFSAVALRLAVQLGERVGLDYEAVYPLAAWANWLVPLVLVELHLRRPRVRALLHAQGT